MSNQLVKRNPVEGYKNVFPKTFIDAIKDRESGASLEEIIQGFNMYFLSYNGNVALTRCKVPKALRKEGLWITYVLYDHTVVTEWYNSDNIDDESWGSDSNWRKASNALVGDISISTDGYWVINGTTTNIKAQGETGTTPLLRVGDNNKIQVTYDEGKNWEDISDYIVPKFRWNQGTGTTAGTIQISMDLGNTWKDLSNPITNNLRISKYIGINESLPTSGVAEGTIYMKGPYYDENDSLNENPIYRMWVYAWKGNTLAWQDNGEFTSISAGVVQERGTSTTQVMSQDAVTRELTELESEVGVFQLHGVVESSFSGGKFFEHKFKKGEQYKITVNSGVLTRIGFYAGTYSGGDIKTINILLTEGSNSHIFVPEDCDYFGVYIAGGVDFILSQIGNKVEVNQLIQNIIDESFDGLLNLRGVIDDGGYYNNDGSVVTDEKWRCGVINLSDYEGKRIRVRFGYRKYYTAHCFIKRLDEFIELESMEDYSINSDFASFICPSDAELYFGYDKIATDRWAKAETSLYEVQNEVHKKEDSKIVYTQNLGTTIRIPIDSLCEMNGRGYFRIVNKGNSTIYYAISIRYGASGKTYLTNAWLLPYESKVLSFDRVNPEATYIDVYPLISGIVYDYEVVIEKENPTIHNELVAIPRLGEGELMVSRSEETYCHSPRILQTDRYISIVYQSAMTRSSESGVKEGGGDYRITMLNMDVVGGVRNYINVMDDAHGYDFLNGYPVEHSYNHAIAYKLEKSESPWARNLYIRFCAICNGKSVMCYKVYNLTTGKMSDVNMQKLSYGGSAVDWTWNNYIKMVNSLYGHSYDETLMERYTLEHSGIFEYNGNFYCVVAHQCTGDDEMRTTNVPFVFMRSADCITWTPIKELWSDMPASECELTINNDICLFACRTTNRGTYYATFDISGNILRSVEQLSSVASKPFPFEYKGNFYCLANIPNENDTTYGWRTEMGIYKLSADNTLIKEKEYKFNSGCQYFAAANVGEDIFIVNNGDIRGLNANAAENYGPSNNISIMKL